MNKLLSYYTYCWIYSHSDLFIIIDVLPFNEANARNAIESVKNISELGDRLNIPSSKMADIFKLPPENQKQKFVEVWFKVDAYCDWKTLRAATDRMKVSEWNITKSMSDSENQLLSPKSSGSRSFSLEAAAAAGMLLAKLQ